MKKRFIAIIVSCLMLMGCASTDQEIIAQDESTETVSITEDTVTRDWIKEQYNLTEADLEGIDVEEIANALLWTKAEILEQYGDNSKMLLNTLKGSRDQLLLLQSQKDNQMLVNLLWDTGMDGELPDFKGLKTIELRALVEDDEYYQEISGYLDVVSKMIYFSENGDVALFLANDEKEQYEMSELSKEELQNILSSLDRQFFVNKLDLKNRDIWMIAFEYEDGSIYNYSLNAVNTDEHKLAMIQLFFDKMSGAKKNSFLELWDVQE